MTPVEPLGLHRRDEKLTRDMVIVYTAYTQRMPYTQRATGGRAQLTWCGGGCGYTCDRTCELLDARPALAIDSIPGPVCRNWIHTRAHVHT